VPKKAYKWTVSPRPGPHKKFESIPLQIIVRDILKLGETGKEAKAIIHKGEIFVDGKTRKDHAYPVGLMDVIAIQKLKKYFRVVPFSRGLKLVEIPEKESKFKICRINGKTVIKKGKMQLNLHDGKNILVDKSVYKTGDSVLIEVPTQKILEHVKLESGNTGMIIKGKNSGKLVKIKEIITTKSREPNKIMCDIEDKEVEVREDYVLVIGKGKPLVAVE
jgi:small subunit ribosomal protein S4e